MTRHTSPMAESRRHRSAALVLSGLLAVSPLAALGAPAAAVDGPTFIVNSTGDAADAGTKRDGACATSGNDCTLRAALMEANAASDHATITFNINGSGPHTIAPATKLPGLTNPLGTTIDGYTQTGASPNTAEHGSNAQIKVEVKGQGPSAFNAFAISTPHNTVRGLALYNWPSVFYLSGPDADDNTIAGNFVCTNAAGTFTAGGTHTKGLGILLTKGPSGNRIGTPALADRNVVSGCFHRGITLSFGGTLAGTTSNTIQNNVIGLNPAGTAALPNRSHGIDINYTGGNLVGGDGPREGNVVSGNNGAGIEISHSDKTNHNSVVGNMFGTDHTGTAAPAHARNGQWGVRLEGPKFCGIDGRPNSTGCTLQDVDEGLPHHNTVRDNVIVNNAKGGVLIDKGQHDNDVVGNSIGVLRDGTKAANGVYGLRFERGAYDNSVRSNIISGNPRGIMVTPMGYYPQGGDGERTYGNTFTLNSIFGNGTAAGLNGIDLVPFNEQNVGQAGSENAHDAIAVPKLDSSTSTASLVAGRACGGCKVEVYISDVAKAGVFGEGKQHLATGTADSAGVFMIVVDSSVAGGKGVTALAFDAVGNTSEFATTIKLPY